MPTPEWLRWRLATALVQCALSGRNFIRTIRRAWWRQPHGLPSHAVIRERTQGKSCVSERALRQRDALERASPNADFFVIREAFE
jgi:hypothetical protein